MPLLNYGRLYTGAEALQSNCPAHHQSLYLLFHRLLSYSISSVRSRWNIISVHDAASQRFLQTHGHPNHHLHQALRRWDIGCRQLPCPYQLDVQSSQCKILFEGC